MYIEFAINIARVDLDRVQREVKPGSDLVIGQSLGEELEYFNFALAQRFNQFSFRNLRFRWTSLLLFGAGECSNKPYLMESGFVTNHLSWQVLIVTTFG